MSLHNIVGQEKAVSMLLGMIGKQRVASSYLFTGEQGIGKKTAAINFSKALNCRQPTPAYGAEASATLHDACDKCDSCLKVESGTHPDFLLLTPEDRQIRIDEIRKIDDILSLRPFEGKHKTVVIDDAETMNISAANAFLKTLEEPPDHSVIILVSSRPDVLPDTIRSRCCRIHFSPLSPASCRTVLAGKTSDNNLDLLVKLSMGRPGAALASDLLEEKSSFFHLLENMLAAEKDGWGSREDMELWFEQVLVMLRDMAVLKISGDSSLLVNSNLKEYLEKLNKSLDLPVIIHIFTELSRVKRLLLFNLNKSVTWNYAASLLRKELSG